MTSYLDVYRERQKLKSQIENKTVSKAVINIHELSENQLGAVNWLIDCSLIQYQDQITKDKLVQLVTEKNFLLLFKIAGLFGVKIPFPNSSKMTKQKESISLLITELQNKNVITTHVDKDLILRCNKKAILNLIECLYLKAMEGSPYHKSFCSYQTISNWLIDLGMIPPYGEDWFSGVDLYLMEDSLRNGEVFRKLCYIFRPDVYEGVLPPATDAKEIMKRISQSLMMLAEDGIIDKEDIQLGPSIVRGDIPVIYQILTKIYYSYLKRLQNLKLDLF